MKSLSCILKPGAPQSFKVILLPLIICVALADFLLYGSGGCMDFSFMLLALFIIFMPLEGAFYRGFGRKAFVCACAVFLFSVFYRPNFFGVAGALFALFILRAASVLDTGSLGLRWLAHWLLFVITLPFEAVMLFARSAASPSMNFSKLEKHIKLWIAPVLFGVLFLVLFSYASPAIGEFFDGAARMLRSFEFNAARVMFWIFAFLILLPLFTLACYSAVAAARKNDEDGEGHFILYGGASVFQPEDASWWAKMAVRALTVFNCIFAIQNFFDLKYIFTGMKLPVGVTHSQFANGGAVALAIATLLAALFIMACFGKWATGDEWKLPRRLVYLWIAQNVMLCMSASLRLINYTADFDLTVTRVAGFAFFGIVFFGFALTAVKVFRNLSVSWLVRANAYAVVCVIAFFSVWNADAFVADFNVNSFITGGSHGIDTNYLCTLNEGSLPAKYRLLAYMDGKETSVIPEFYEGSLREKTEAQLRALEIRMLSFRTHSISDALIFSKISQMPQQKF